MSSVASSARTSLVPATVVIISVSHGDSAISHPRDQDYLSLKVGKGVCEVELQQATSIWWLRRKREREEKAKHGREARSDQEVILKRPTSDITPTPYSLPGPRREETITVTHAVDVF